MNALANHDEQQRAAYLYAACARAEGGSIRAQMFARLAGQAEAQAAIWRARITSRGLPAPPPFAPDLRTRLVARLVAILGPRRLRAVLAGMKVRTMVVYAAPVPRPVPPADAEPEHPPAKNPGSIGGLRAVVLGVNDGLVSNASLILGVAGAGSDPKLVIVSGIAGLAAGAFAVAAGEYVAVRMQHDLLDHQIGHERAELARAPQSEVQELALIYATKGLPQRGGARLAKRVVADSDHALDALARDQLALDPGELGAPATSAATSFAAFAAGAVLPLLSFALAPAAWGLPLTAGVAALALVVLGASLSLFTGRSAWRSAAQLLTIGATAGAVAFGLGHVVGATLG